jgi:hypothetical protein
VTDKPLDKFVAALRAEAAAHPQETIAEAVRQALAPLQDSLSASWYSTPDAAAVFAAAADEALRRAIPEMPPYVAPEWPQLSTEAYLNLERGQAGIPGDPAQAAAQLARLLTTFDPGDLATALRRLADALDGLAPTEEGSVNDD